jgi:nucleoside-diphosphate-sugar epimerase
VRIVEGFLARGADVTVFSRGRRRPPFWGRIRHIAGDRADRRTFVRNLERQSFDVVVDNIAYERADVESAAQALRGRIGHYILTSTGSVYRSDAPVLGAIGEDEADLALRGDSSYAEGKRDCEAFLRAQRPFNFTILRPPVVLGPEDPTRRAWFWIQRLLDGGPILVPDKLPAPLFRLACSGDVARAVLHVAGVAKAYSRAYNVAMEELITLTDFVRLVAAELGRPDPSVIVPQRVLSQDAPWYRPTYAERFVLDIARLRGEIGFTTTPLKTWLAETIRWHVDNAAALEPSGGYASRSDELVIAQSRQA